MNHMWQYLGVDVAEAGDHAVVGVDKHLGLLAAGRGEHDGVGVGVVPGAHGEAPGEVAGAAVAGGGALPDVGRRHRHGHLRGHGHPHLGDVRHHVLLLLLPGEAPLRAQPPLLRHRVSVVRVAAPHPPSRAAHSAIACSSSTPMSFVQSFPFFYGLRYASHADVSRATASFYLNFDCIILIILFITFYIQVLSLTLLFLVQ